MADQKTGDNQSPAVEAENVKQARLPLEPGTVGFFDPFTSYTGRKGSHAEFDDRMMNRDKK
jgi:hypothetical protein